MNAVAVVVVAVFAACAIAFTAWGMVLIRRHNQHLAELARRPVTPMRMRHLNVVDRCDRTPGCHARSHDPTCMRGREVGPFINSRLDEIDEEGY